MAHGGSFEIEGKTVVVSAADVERHLRLMQRYAPGKSASDTLLLAWSRAINIAGAQALGISISDEEFRAHLDREWSRAGATWMKDGVFDETRFLDHIRAAGFADEAEYFAHCREGALSEKFLEHRYPKTLVDEALVKERFARMNRQLSVSALVFAPEFLPGGAEPSKDDPKTIADYVAWYETVPDFYRRSFDDVNRPAIETEAVYVRFCDYAPDSFRAWFEELRPALGGKSFDAVTADIVPTPHDYALMKARWTKWRKTNYAWLDAHVPPKTTDEESFLRLRDHFLREYRMIKYLERLWREGSGMKAPVDLKALAKKYSLPFIHVPFGLLSIHGNHPVVSGDHVFSIRKTEPGAIYDYQTTPDNYFAAGVVDQIGIHAAVFKLVRAEEMRVLPALEVRDRAWADFTRDWLWTKSSDLAVAFDKEARAAASEMAKEKGGDARPAAFYAEALKAKIGRPDIPGARRLGPFFLKPFRREDAKARTEGTPGERTRNFFLLEFGKVGSLEKDYAPGDVLTPASSPERRLHLIPIVDAILPPPQGLWEKDKLGRDLARASIEAEVDRSRLAKLTGDYVWPTILKTFKLKAPALEALKTEELRRAVANTSRPTSAPAVPAESRSK